MLIKKKIIMYEAIIQKWRLCFHLTISCSDVHTTKCSGGHENLVKMIKNAGVAGNLKKKLSGKELMIIIY